MATNLNQADILFLLNQVIFGSNPPPGTDPLSLDGLRAIDGTNNNLTDVTIVDQFGNIVDTSTFALVDQPFFNIVGATSPNAYDPTFDYADAGTETFLGLTPDAVHNGDASPRIISNLVADMSAANPAVPDSAIGNQGAPAFFVPPTNALFSFFGQFFDHGLDFINKGGSGIIEIPLLPTDPHYGLSPVNSMFVDRATLDGSLQTINSTAPLVEQSQTYGQRDSTTFYLKEYDGSGTATGRLVTHEDGGMATWADIKANALNKGIILEDHHVLDIPDPDAWGSIDPTLFDPAANGGLGGFLAAAGTGQAFLADIAHVANPAGKTADVDAALGLTGDPATFFDNELLDAHKIAGDPRANENIALTAIHTAFHSEHNRILSELEDLIAQREQTTPGFAAQWDGDRLFEAAKLINEMQYQHFVFEEFARRLSPNVDEFAQYDITINPNISTEFSQAVYRLGHSMLTDTVMTANAADQVDDMTLITAFLNPLEFDAVGAGALIEGQTRQQMNEIDEFVVDALRNFLVGLPLDLAAINIARGRDVGLGTLNQTREHLFNATGEGTLAPYTSWSDFGDHLLHPDSLVNFIAAYARDATILAAREAGDNAGARALAAAAMEDGGFMDGGDLGFEDIDLWIGGLAEAKAVGPLGQPGMLGTTFDFIFSTQLRALQDGDRLYYLARLGGTNILDQIESSTFGDLFERGTGARHTNGDIFSNPDEHVELSALGVSDFSSVAGDWREVIGGTTVANTINAGDGNDTIWGEDGDDTLNGGAGNDHIFGNAGDDILFGGSGNDFVRGDAGNDMLFGDIGDDLLFGLAGNDTLNGGQGLDELFGGLGNDTLNGGDQDDALFGQEHDDILTGGLGDDALEGGSGDDHLSGSNGADTLLGLEGNDILVGGSGADVLDGGLGFYDLATFEGSPIGLTIDMTNPAASTGNAMGDTFIDVEEVRGTAFNDQIIGDLGDNVLSGGGGSDTLNGGAGNDTLYSNEGQADNLIGGLDVDMAVFLGHTMGEYIINVSTAGDGTVQENFGAAAIDTVAGVEQLAFDDGLWSVVTQEYVPLVGLSDSTTQFVNGVEIDGNLVNTIVVNDDTNIPLNGIFVANIEIIDPDGANGTRTVTLAGADAASFRIVNGAGGVQELRYIGGRDLGLAKANYEVTPQLYVTVDVADNSGGSAINYLLRITDVNDNAPVFTSPDDVFVQEATPTDTVVYRATADDLDTVGSPITYSFVDIPSDPDGPNDNALFTFGNPGEIHFISAPDFATPLDVGGVAGDNRYEVVIEASDGTNTTTKRVMINVTDTGSAPVFISSPPTPFEVPENTLAATIIYDADATDADGPAPSYTLEGADAGLFNIDAVTGEVRFNSAPDFEKPADANGDNIYELSVGATDGFHTTLQAISIDVTNVVGNTINGTAGVDNVNVSETVPGEDPLTQEEDTVNGNDGADRLYGWDGNDILSGGLGNDVLIGDRGDDQITGGADTDYILGGAGDDILDGGTGIDKLVGGEGSDTLIGGDDRDYLIGADGPDDDGADILDGGLGDDWLFADSTDTVQGGDGYDILVAEGLIGLVIDIAAANIEQARGGDFADVFDGSGETTEALRLLGNGGDDLLIGGDIGDILYGGQHRDHLIGNGGADFLVGDADDDILEGGAGNDRLEGRSGNDTLMGGAGLNYLYGGTGADTFSAAGYDGVTDQIFDYSFAEGDEVEGASYTVVGPDTLVWDGAGGTGNVLFQILNYDADASGLNLFL